MVVVVDVVVVVGVDLVGGEEISMEFGFNPPLEYLKHYHVSSNSNFGYFGWVVGLQLRIHLVLMDYEGTVVGLE